MKTYRRGGHVYPRTGVWGWTALHLLPGRERERERVAQGAYNDFVDADVFANSKGRLGGEGLVLCPRAWTPPPLLK